MKIRLQLFFALFIVQALGCATLKDLTKSSFKKPKLSYKEVSLREWSFEGVTMDFVFTLNNPNAVAVKLASLDYQLDFDGKKFVAGKTEKELEVVAKGSSEVTLPVTVAFRELADSVSALLEAKDEIAYRLETGFGVNTPIGLVRLPAKTDGTLPLPKLPKVRLGGVTMDKVTFTGTTLRFAIDIENRATFPVAVKGLGYKIEVAQVPVSEGTSTTPDIKPGVATRIDVPVRLDFLRLGAAAVKVIKSGTVPYAVNGELDLGLFSQPFKFEGNASL